MNAIRLFDHCQRGLATLLDTLLHPLREACNNIFSGTPSREPVPVWIDVRTRNGFRREGKTPF